MFKVKVEKSKSPVSVKVEENKEREKELRDKLKSLKKKKKLKKSRSSLHGLILLVIIVYLTVFAGTWLLTKPFTISGKLVYLDEDTYGIIYDVERNLDISDYELGDYVNYSLKTGEFKHTCLLRSKCLSGRVKQHKETIYVDFDLPNKISHKKLAYCFFGEDTQVTGNVKVYIKEVLGKYYISDIGV